MLKVRSHSSRAWAIMPPPMPGLLEQEMDLFGAVAVRDLIAEWLELRRVGHLGDMAGDAQALQQARGGSHKTPRWREQDSNPRSLSRRETQVRFASRWWACGVRPGRLEDVCCGKNCSVFTGGFFLNLTV